MDYNKPTIADEIGDFKYTMKQTNTEITPAEMIDCLLEWQELYTGMVRRIAAAETADDWAALKRYAEGADAPEAIIWGCRQIARVILAADSLLKALDGERFR